MHTPGRASPRGANSGPPLAGLAIPSGPALAGRTLRAVFPPQMSAGTSGSGRGSLRPQTSSFQPQDPLRPDSPSGHKPACWEFGHLLMTLKGQLPSCSVSARGPTAKLRARSAGLWALAPFPLRHQDFLEVAGPVSWRGKALGRVWNILALQKEGCLKKGSRGRAHERKDSSSGQARCDGSSNTAMRLSAGTTPPWSERGLS